MTISFAPNFKKRILEKARSLRSMTQVIEVEGGYFLSKSDALGGAYLLYGEVSDHEQKVYLYLKKAEA